MRKPTKMFLRSFNARAGRAHKKTQKQVCAKESAHLRDQPKIEN